MSSSFDNDEVVRTGDHGRRSVSINKLSAARRFGDFVRGLWPGAETPESPDQEEREAGVAQEDESGENSTQEPVGMMEPAAIAEPAIEDEQAPEPAGPDRFDLRVLWAPKGGNDEKEWEDGYATNAGSGVVALADGAGDGIFSKLWADLLLESFVACPFSLDEAAVVEPWIDAKRRAWFEAIRYSEQRWSIQMKVDRSCGAATFIALVLDPVTERADSPDAPIGWTAWAVGDACLFHIRGGQLTATFPVTASSEFGTTPQLYQSKPLRATPMAVMTRGELGPDDQIVLATDAVAQRLLADVEAGTPPDWNRFWDLDQESWRAELVSLREQNAIVNDDCTLLTLRVPASTPEFLERPETAQEETPTRQTTDVDTPFEPGNEQPPSSEDDHEST